mgnify:CR=1 FL=1
MLLLRIALKRKSDFRGYASTSSDAIDLLSRSRPGIACIVESEAEFIYGDVFEFIVLIIIQVF